MNPRPFKILVPSEKLARIRAKVAAYPWNAMPETAGWSAGASKTFMRALGTHWLENYDWRSAEGALNRYPQFIVSIDGTDIHFYHVRGSGAGQRTLLLLHGWPGSVCEFLPLIDALAGSTEGFDLVIPSLPGYGFSGIPAAPLGARDVASMMARLMTQVLGYDSYISQGGDWGGILSSWIGIIDPDHCAGVHLNMIVPGDPDPEMPDEMAWAARFAELQRTEGAYGHLQMTRPQSLGFAMEDSPVGAAAWIVEKFAAWSDLPRDSMGQPDLLSRYSFDHLLTNIMMYLAQDRFTSATWLYHGSLAPGQLPFRNGEYCAVPTAIAAFPDPVFVPPPRSLAERLYNVVRWTVMPRGGHFAAMEAPNLFVDDVKAFGRQIFG